MDHSGFVRNIVRLKKSCFYRIALGAESCDLSGTVSNFATQLPRHPVPHEISRSIIRVSSRTSSDLKSRVFTETPSAPEVSIFRARSRISQPSCRGIQFPMKSPDRSFGFRPVNPPVKTDIFFLSLPHPLKI